MLVALKREVCRPCSLKSFDGHFFSLMSFHTPTFYHMLKLKSNEFRPFYLLDFTPIQILSYPRPIAFRDTKLPIVSRALYRTGINIFSNIHKTSGFS